MYPYIYCTLGWFLFYFILQKVNSRSSSDGNNRICAFLHGLILCRMVEYNIGHPLDFNKFGSESLPWHNSVILLTGSYYVYDTLYCLCKKEGIVMLAHHVISLSCSLHCYYYNHAGQEFIIVFWLHEFTNPLLQFRWFLRSLELQNTKVAIFNEFLFTVLFFVNRIFIGSYIGYRLFVNGTSIFLDVAYILLCVVNINFSHQLIRMVMRKIIKMRTTKSTPEIYGVGHICTD